MPGASADSICAPAAARVRRRAAISTSGSSGIRPRVGCDRMRISVAADERTGVADAVVEELRARGHEPLVHGALDDDERDDWAWGSEAAARDVAEGRADQAVVCCWTGTGASIAANKVAGVRAALCADAETARGRAPLERRQRARAVAAHHQRGAARGDPRRLVRGRAERRRGRPGERPSRRRDRLSARSGQRAALGITHPGHEEEEEGQQAHESRERQRGARAQPLGHRPGEREGQRREPDRHEPVEAGYPARASRRARACSSAWPTPPCRPWRSRRRRRRSRTSATPRSTTARPMSSAVPTPQARPHEGHVAPRRAGTAEQQRSGDRAQAAGRQTVPNVAAPPPRSLRMM